MWKDKLEGYKIILASGSPRRKQFFQEMGLEFEVRLKAVEEVYPKMLKGGEISDYLAQLKATALKESLIDHEILITSDTVVWYKGRSLAKPADKEEAFAMLKALSNDWHDVITSVCFTTTTTQKTVNHTTKVKFKKLTTGEIDFYIENYRPYDKAGGYGIQEWIGLIGIEEIQGSYTNVVGLPTQLVYKTLMDMVD
ncbi:Maf family nucleotide pyrophosphatase [Maribacter polysaccharolyticus]|uniref:Maf family nucleotide pyrophosphatase n=1 Tax=Maribacter polysaccharolyticus TaxID=3020831 RepID=UPI00237FD0D8|nr:Maf family nucleotide pyrophosphatase [Maribacter polysaccharolyticus]MDE3740326.1 Maf family nucleotide pyrophosphatase [Maribacter polysaccharolyticus]